MTVELETRSHRPGWDETWLAMAQTVAFRSRCTKRQVGALIVTRDNRPLIASYNGPARGHQVSEDCRDWCPRSQSHETSANYDTCFSIHAEANALVRADYTEMHGGTIYVSSASCINCAKLVANSGLSRLVHVVSPKDQYRDPDGVETYLRMCGLSAQRATRVETL